MFVSIQHSILRNAFTGQDEDVWEIHSQTYPIGSHTVDKLAPKVIREMFDSFEGLKRGYNAKVQIMSDDAKLDAKTVLHRSGNSMAFKDAMVQMGMVGDDSPWKTNRKLSVVMVLTSSGFPRSTEQKDVTFIINGKEFKLSPEGVKKVIEKKRLLEMVYGTYYYWTGDKKDLTRSKNGKQVLTWLATNLLSEPQELRDALAKASEQ